MSTRVNRPKKNTPPSRPNNRTALFATGAVVLGGVAVAIWAGGKALIPDAPPAEQAVEQPAQPVQPAAPREQAPPTEPETQLFSDSMLAAEEEEPEEPAQPEQAENETNIPFKLEEVASALSHIELDENGDIVLNETVQTVLERAFLDARATMNEEQLAELKAMIEAGLGGQAGEQAVQIADKFYRYSNAFQEISDTLAVRSDPQSLRQDYEQITRLRRAHLGPELADQLYAREEQMTRYTLEVMEIQADPDLTPEQRTEKQQELAARYPEVMPNGGETDEDPSDEQITN
ncbi:lipase secretion chaperone [Marinobacter lacisalsi]|uniref:Lipase chaperone n=1 Tax=Marinobacter lacisalsi TaxID=475979 RepID=A0ABV8QL80_9GAMM